MTMTTTQKSEFWNSRLILKTYAGSISYGTNTPESDKDYRGVCIPPASYLLGLDRFEQKENRQPDDEVIYALSKFVNLALDNNPNILDVLFVAENHIVSINEFGKDLRDIRSLFVSKKCYHTYGGYAVSQLKRMTVVDYNAEGKRAEIVERFGYDTKNAMHLIRLLRMGIEILTDGEVNVLRHDNQELLKIRRGVYSLKEIEEEALHLRRMLDLAYVNSKLPSRPDYAKVNTWLVKTHKEALQWTA